MLSRTSSAIWPNDDAPHDDAGTADALLTEIRHHDLRRHVPMTETMRIRAEARLEQILASPAPAESPVAVAATLSPRWRTRLGFLRPRNPAAVGLRLAAIIVVAAVIVGISTLLPAGTGVQPAFASWTPTPTAVAPDVEELADAVCLQGLNRSLRSLNASQIGNAMTELTGPPAIAEQRGDWVLLNYADGEQHAGCLIQLSASGSLVRSSWVNTESGSSFMSTTPSGEEFEFGAAGTGEEFEFGGSGAISVVRDPEANGVRSFNVSQVSVPDAGTIRVFSGQVSQDVVGLTISTGVDGQIEATVSDGIAIAWWPSELDPNIEISGFTLTNADGSVVEDSIGISQPAAVYQNSRGN